MRIAYLIYYDLSEESGVLKKVHTQISSWTSLGHQVKLFGLSSQSAVWEGFENIEYTVFHNSSRWTRNADYKKLTHQLRLWKPDIINWRSGTYVYALEKLFYNIPSVIEINSYDLGEKRQTLPKYKYLYHKYTRERLLSTAKGYVCVTNELASQHTYFEKPIEVIGNSINLAEYPTLGSHSGEHPSLVFLASTLSQIWHGVDKIVWLARQLPNCKFTIIGSKFPQHLTVEKPLPTNMTVHGYLNKSAYEQVLMNSDIGISTLALHRKSMDEACALKMREYLAYGLPVITGNLDTDFPDSAPFILQLPNTQDNVQMYLGEVQNFISYWHKRRVDRAAIKHIDVKYKERKRLDFFSRIIA